MKSINTLLSVAILLVPFAFVHSYSASDYDSEHRPSNLTSAIAHSACAVRVQEFASKHRALEVEQEYWESGVGETEMRAEYEEKGLDVDDPAIQLWPGIKAIDLRAKFHFLKEDYTKLFADCLAMTHVEESKVPEAVEKKFDDETQKLKEAELLKQQQLAQEQARKEAEAARKQQEEIDAAASQNLTEQAAGQNKEESVQSPESDRVNDTQANEIEQPQAEPTVVGTPAEKPSFFQRIKNFFGRWF